MYRKIYSHANSIRVIMMMMMIEWYEVDILKVSGAVYTAGCYNVITVFTLARR